MKCIFLLFFLQLSVSNLFALRGKVVSVIEGDVIHFKADSNHEYKIRLYGIDAPEMKQQHGKEAKKVLADKILKKSVRIEVNGMDRYGRTTGIVVLDKISINRWLVENGWAWQYRQYDQSDVLRDAQKSAHRKRLGLWQGTNPIPPWEFRKNVK
ncbi:MAG: thermonuclease family protein [Verrucomicrobiota bacterium]